MRILIINDFYIQGGAEVQAKDLYNLLSLRGHDVRMITFDPKFATGEKEENHYNYRRSNRLIGKLFNKFFINLRAKVFINRILDDFCPDVIHLHNNLKMTRTVNACIGKYKIIQTFHDFGFICPKGTCVRDDGDECAGYFAVKCDGCRVSGVRKNTKISEIKKNKKWINEHVSQKMSPSDYLANKLKINGFHSCFLFPNLINGRSAEKVRFEGKQNFLYCGVISEEKGIVNLVRAFWLLKQRGSNCRLEMIGGVDSKFSRRFETLLSETDNVTYLGRLPHEEVIARYANALCLIVPSLWLENYPNVMLEAVLAGTLCIGSNRGGIVEILRHDEDLMFSPLSAEEIVMRIIYVSGLSEAEYMEKLEPLRQRILSFNGAENVYDSFIKAVGNDDEFNG